MEKKEAMKILKDFHDKSALFSIRTALDTIIPELKESEDERIKKALLKMVNDTPRDIIWDNYGVHKEDAIDWFENQGNVDNASYEIAEKEKHDFVNGQFIDCRKSFDEFKEDNSYWLEYVGNDIYIGRSDNILGKEFHITPRQLYCLFAQQHCPKESNMNEETNAPTEYEYALKSFKDEDVRKFMQYIEKEAKAYEFNLPNRSYDIYAFAKDILYWLEKQGKSSVQIHYWTEEEIEPIISDYLRGAENYGGMIGRLRCLKPKSFEKQGRQEQLYIRFGEIPTDEKSKIYQGEIEVGIENGVSVYPAFKTNEGDIVLGLTLPITKTTLYTQQYLIEYDDRPCYLVKGDYVGKDTDGQPLISNVSIVEKIDSYRIKEEKQGEKPQGKSALKVIKEEKVDNANKIEPKFHKGEWVVWNNQYYKVNYNSCGYELVDQNGLSTSLEYGTVDKSAHVFSIKDAKDGDVLVCEDFGYTSLMLFESFSNGRILLHCWHNSQTNNFHINTDVELRKNAKVYPATKEQRDALLKAMTDAGYIFDFEKKELKKLEKQGNQDVAEDSAKVSESSTEEKDMTEYKKGYACGLQRVLKYPEDFNLYKKFEWSEEDETGLTNIIIMLKEGASHHFIKDDITKAVAWLKSLKPQNRWKPTEEQINALKWQVDHTSEGLWQYKATKELLEQLKQL